jgi:hypothetical protein
VQERNASSASVTPVEHADCTECGAEISSESEDDKEEITITKWNRRYNN